MSTVRWSESGPFAIVPEWLLDARIERQDVGKSTLVSDRAVRLYAILARYADKNRQAIPGRKALALRLECALSTLDTAIQDLLDVGALTVEMRRREDGSRTSNSYVIHALRRVPTHREGGTDQPIDPPTDEPVGKNESQEEREGVEANASTPGTAIARRGEPAPVSPPAKVDRKPVRDGEATLAVAVLAEWNRQAGQTLSSKDWLAKIVMRVREHPELGEAEHAHVIAAALAAPWWKGPASPSVVYGSGEQFERSLLAVQHVPRIEKREEPGRYGRGMTTKQTAEMFGLDTKGGE